MANNHRDNKINDNGKPAKQRNRHDHHDCGTLELIPTRPGAFFKFFLRFAKIIRDALESAFAPQDHKDHCCDHDANDDR